LEGVLAAVPLWCSGPKGIPWQQGHEVSWVVDDQQASHKLGLGISTST
jgi:hypothetical protein